jgi:hypothetical protein
MGTTLTFIPVSRVSLFHLIKLGKNRWATRFGCSEAAAAKHSRAPVRRHNPHNHPIMVGENK